MSTASNITDEQINSLTVDDLTEQDIGDYAGLAELVRYATGRCLHSDLGRVQCINEARARCAEILEARAAK